MGLERDEANVGSGALIHDLPHVVAGDERSEGRARSAALSDPPEALTTVMENQIRV